MNRIFLIISLFFISTLLSASTDINNYVEEANRQYIQGDYESAFTQINHYFFVLDGEEPSTKANDLGEKIYYFYIRSLFSSDDFIGTTFIEKSIRINENIRSERVLNALKILKDTDEILIENTPEEESIVVSDVEYTITERNYSNHELTTMLKNSLLQGEKNSKQVSTVTILLTMLIIAIFMCIISLVIYIFLSVSSSKKKHVISPDKFSPILIGNTEKSVLEFDNLLKDCQKIGLDIDEITCRKNNAVNSAELVYKISIKLGYSKEDSLQFFAATLVYDIGLLGIDSRILRSESVTAEEFEKIKKHVIYGETSLSFIPYNYKPLFVDAVTKHHENLDGTGYPNGLVDEQIPYIARVLRVVESYLSLISSRKYRVISDKVTAINSLQQEPTVYDQSIVEVLDKVI